ncbi:PST-A protein, partial [Plasmodium cynomolgi strain B]
MVQNELCDSEAVLKCNSIDGKPQLDSFLNKDGLMIRTYGWLVKNAIGIIILVHGLNSHVRFSFLRHNVDIVGNEKAILKDENNYYVYKDSWIEHFNKNGYSVYGIDLQGHGKSDGWENLRVNVKRFDDIAYDVIEYIQKIQEKLWKNENSCDTLPDDNKNVSKKDIPTYLIGQSMGGNVVLRTLQLIGKSKDEAKKKLNIKGCISLSGMISIERIIASPRSYKLINNMLYIKYQYMHDLYKYDKIRYKKGITYRFAYQLLKAMDNLQKDMKHIPKDIPILFIHSKDDTLCYYRGVVSFYSRLSNDIKELHILEDMEHMLTVEPGNENVLNKIMQWLSKLTPKGVTTKFRKKKKKKKFLAFLEAHF